MKNKNGDDLSIAAILHFVVIYSPWRLFSLEGGEVVGFEVIDEG